MKTLQTLEEIKKKVTRLLEEDSRFGGTEIIPAFTGKKAPLHPAKPVISIGIEQVETAPGGLGSYLGRENQVGYHGLQAEILFFFTCQFPQDVGLSGWDRLFEGLCENLLTSSLGVSKVWQTTPEEKPHSMTTAVTARARLHTLLALSEDDRMVRDVTIHYKGGTL